MSFITKIKKIFSGKSNLLSAAQTFEVKPPAASQSGTAAAVQKIDGTIEVMELREAILLKKIDREISEAKDAMNKKNKNHALLAMKKKKIYEDQLNKLMAQRTNLEYSKGAVEEVAMTALVLQAQREVGNELARLNHGMDADKAEEIIDNVREQVEKHAEIQNMLAEPMLDAMYDQDDAMRDLQDLLNEGKEPTVRESITAPPSILIHVPTSALPHVKEDNDEKLYEELKALEASLAI